MVNKIIISSDWKENLYMYQLGNSRKKRIESLFPEVKLDFINCKGLNLNNPNAHVYIGNRVSEGILDIMPKVKWVHFGSIGTDKLSDNYLKSRNITVTNSRGTMEEAVASSALSFVFALSRGLSLLKDLRLQKNFNRSFIDQHIHIFDDVYNSNFCILGYGPIAKLFISMISKFSGNISIITRSERKNFKNIKFYKFSESKAALKNAKFVINFLPHSEMTENYVNKSFLKNIKEKAYYVNVGRHSTNDEDQLIKFVESGNLIGVGLDVYDKNNVAYKNMLKNTKFILTPHVAGVSNSYWKKQMNLLEHNISCYREESLNKMKNLVYLKGIKK